MDGKKDTQSNKYLMTINNPLNHGFTHEAIKDTLLLNFKTLEYFCMADEKGATDHSHIFVYFRSRVRWSMLKKHFPPADIEASKGSIKNCIEYVSKTGKWENDEKQETAIEGTFEEYGNRPQDSGKNFEMAQIMRMVEDGYNNADIIRENSDLLYHKDKLDWCRTTLLIDEYRDKVRLDLKVTYISGATGKGKTRGVLENHGARNVYRITDYKHPFDGYNGQPVILFDEFRNSLPIGDMLNYLDIYPLELPARYNNKFACYDFVYICTNWELEKQYETADRETYEAFLRRIHKVKVYGDDAVTEYESVTDYENRGFDFE